MQKSRGYWISSRGGCIGSPIRVPYVLPPVLPACFPGTFRGGTASDAVEILCVALRVGRASIWLHSQVGRPLTAGPTRAVRHSGVGTGRCTGACAEPAHGFG